MLKILGGKRPRLRLALWVVLALLAGVMVAGNTTAFAATPVTAGGKATVVNTDGYPIRVRQGAGTEFAQIAAAYEGQVVSVLEGPSSDSKGKQWFMVKAPSGTGWMMADFLQGTAAPPSTPKITSSARVANTNGDPLRLRSAPNTSGSVLTLLDPGVIVVVQDGPVTDASGIVWYKTTAKGLTGWAMAQYLVQEAPVVPADKKEVVPVAPVVAAKPAVAPTATATVKPAEKPRATPTVATNATKSGGITTLAQYRQWMEEARTLHPYKQTVDKMWSVMMCESGGNVRASGGGGSYLGLFQYAPGTWGGSWNPYRGNSIWDARSQIFATAKAWGIGMQSHWSCYYITAGR